MELKEKFKVMMEESPQIALATITADGKHPNVRMMCFYYDFNTKRIYFGTFKGSEKVVEFEKNPHVAFSTFAIGDEDWAARVDHAIVRKTNVDKAIILEELSKKLPLFNQIKSGDTSNILVYEIEFAQAHLHIGHDTVVLYDNQ